jgi:uncharacterized protein
MNLLIQYAIGLLFGLGLVVSGMANPAKVLNFLDLFGSWDASLALVMGGAVLVTYAGYRLAWRRPRPMLAERFDLPVTTMIDRRLLIGSAIFGLGWGLAGYCPGPALVGLALAAPGTLVFIPAMLAGMWLARGLAMQSARRETQLSRDKA